MLTQRPPDLARARDLLLELHALGNYESDTPHTRADGFEAYRERWFASRQPQVYLDALNAAIAGDDAVIQVWERDGVPIAYLWVAFTDVPGYEIRIAEIDEIAILPAHQAQGSAPRWLQRPRRSRVRAAPPSCAPRRASRTWPHSTFTPPPALT